MSWTQRLILEEGLWACAGCKVTLTGDDEGNGTYFVHDDACMELRQPGGYWHTRWLQACERGDRDGEAIISLSVRNRELVQRLHEAGLPVGDA